MTGTFWHDLVSAMALDGTLANVSYVAGLSIPSGMGSASERLWGGQAHWPPGPMTRIDYLEC